MSTLPRIKPMTRRTPAALRQEAHGLEALEPRRLLTTYQYAPLTDALDLDRLIREAQGPGVEVQGFGASVVALGDVDGDGAADFAVSAPGVRGSGLHDGWTSPEGGGRVFIYSGRTASVIRVLTDQWAGFGASMANIGDVNGDGVADLAVGSPMASPQEGPLAGAPRVGRVWVYSGADGAVIRMLEGAAVGSDFGWAVAAAGDINGDGVGDLIVGAPGAAASDPGAAFVYSGADWSVLHTLVGERAGDRFGFAVAGGIDVPVEEGENEDDGVPEFLIGAPGHDVEGVGEDAGRAYAFDGATGNVRFTFSGENAGDRFGHSVLMVGNARINRDFIFRWAVGAPGFDAPVFDDDFQHIGVSPDAGRVYRFAARGFVPAGDPPFIFGANEGARLGSELFTIGDVSRFNEFDDMEEWAATAPGAAAPEDRLRIFDGNPTNASVFLGEALVDGATRITLGGDLDGDGINEVILVNPLGAGTARERLAPVMIGTERLQVVAASENGRYAVLQTIRNVAGAPLVGYLSVDGTLTPLPLVPGLMAGDNILAINDLGLIFGTTEATDQATLSPFGALDRFFFVYNGERRLLSEVIGSFQGGAAPTTVSFVAMSNTGDVIFNAGSPAQGGAWLYRGGVMRFLWAGVASGVNDAGVVVGTTNVVFTGNPPIGPQGVGIAMLADGSIVHLPQLLNATAVNDRGEIVGTSAATRGLAVLHNGVLTDHGLPEGVDGATAVWVASDIDETGRIVATVTWSGSTNGRPPSTNPAGEYIFEPGVGLRLLRDAVEGDPEVDLPFVQTGVRWITALNRLIAPGAVLTPLGATEAIDPSGTPWSASAGEGGVYVGAVNQDGVAIVLRLSGVGIEVQRLSGPTAEFVFTDEVVTYTDARDGRVYAVARVGVDLQWFVQNADGIFEARGPLPLDAGAQFEGPLTVFTSADGRAHIVGRLASGGDIAMVYQTNAQEPDSIENWQYANLSLSHFRARGLEAPVITGPLTSYATRWGGMNIAGLNEAGEIQVIWWAPGLVFWEGANLSAIAGTPALEGRIAAMVLPWDGITLTGVAAETGELWATWWAPGFGGAWRADSLSKAAGSDLKLDPASITSYVAPWGGQNIAGRNAETGELVVYWWAPGVAWTAERIAVETPLTTGALVSLVDGSSFNIFVRAAEVAPEEGGDSLRLLWRPDGLGWRLENLTVLVADVA